MKTLIIFLLIFYMAYNLVASSNNKAVTYYCGVGQKYVKKQIKGGRTHLVKKGFEIACNAKNVEFVNDDGKKWRAKLTVSKEEKDTPMTLKLEPESVPSGKPYIVVVKQGYPYIGLHRPELELECMQKNLQQ